MSEGSCTRFRLDGVGEIDIGSALICACRAVCAGYRGDVVVADDVGVMGAGNAVGVSGCGVGVGGCFVSVGFSLSCEIIWSMSALMLTSLPLFDIVYAASSTTGREYPIATACSTSW